MHAHPVVRDGGVGELFVPGRLCLFGEHSDWAGGWRRARPELSPGVCLVAGTDQGIRGEAEAAGAFEITSVLASGEEIGPARIEARPAALARRRAAPTSSATRRASPRR